MNKKNITPNPQQPVDRVSTGQLPTLLVELEEVSLGSTYALPSYSGESNDPFCHLSICSYGGEDE